MFLLMFQSSSTCSTKKKAAQRMSDAALTARMVRSILHPDYSTVGTINDAGPVADTISQIKELSGTLLEDRESSLSDLEMEHPPTPDSRPLICMDQ